MKVQVLISSSEYITEEADPNDSWDRPNTATEINSVRVVKTDKELPDDYRYQSSDVFEVSDDAKLVYVVIARYSTGDTFGNDDGHYAVFDVLTEEWQVSALMSKILDTVPGWTPDGKVNTKYEFEYNDKTHIVPWSGYFESFEDVEVHEVTIGAN